MSIIEKLKSKFLFDYVHFVEIGNLIEFENGKKIIPYMIMKNAFFKEEHIKFKGDVYYSMKKINGGIINGCFCFVNISVFKNKILYKYLYFFKQEFDKRNKLKLLNYFYKLDKRKFNYFKNYFKVSNDELIELYL